MLCFPLRRNVSRSGSNRTCCDHGVGLTCMSCPGGNKLVAFGLLPCMKRSAFRVYWVAVSPLESYVSLFGCNRTCRDPGVGFSCMRAYSSTVHPTMGLGSSYMLCSVRNEACRAQAATVHEATRVSGLLACHLRTPGKPSVIVLSRTACGHRVYRPA